jgi:polyhydroxyalkanoate synthesis regulator phasin
MKNLSKTVAPIREMQTMIKRCQQMQKTLTENQTSIENKLRIVADFTVPQLQTQVNDNVAELNEKCQALDERVNQTITLAMLE